MPLRSVPYGSFTGGLWRWLGSGVFISIGDVPWGEVRELSILVEI